MADVREETSDPAAHLGVFFLKFLSMLGEREAAWVGSGTYYSPLSSPGQRSLHSTYSIPPYPTSQLVPDKVSDG